jgi:hypothetical protein
MLALPNVPPFPQGAGERRERSAWIKKKKKKKKNTSRSMTGAPRPRAWQRTPLLAESRWHERSRVARQASSWLYGRRDRFTSVETRRRTQESPALGKAGLGTISPLADNRNSFQGRQHSSSPLSSRKLLKLSKIRVDYLASICQQWLVPAKRNLDYKLKLPDGLYGKARTVVQYFTVAKYFARSVLFFRHFCLSGCSPCKVDGLARAGLRVTQTSSPRTRPPWATLPAPQHTS